MNRKEKENKEERSTPQKIQSQNFTPTKVCKKKGGGWPEKKKK